MATAVDADIGPLCDKMQWPLLSWDAMEASDFDIVKKVCNKVTLTRSPITIESSPQRAGYHLPGKSSKASSLVVPCISIHVLNRSSLVFATSFQKAARVNHYERSSN